MKTQKVTFKRRELINNRVTFHFSIFVLISIVVVVFFLFEDYKLTLSSDLPAQKEWVAPSGEDDLGTFLTGGLFSNPLTLIVLGLWLLLCAVFSKAFNTRLKPMFRVFFWLSLGVVVIFNFWTYFVSLALSSPDKSLLKWVSLVNYSFTSKAIVLIMWGFFSIFMSFSYVTAKYIGVFNRLNYLFDSIHRGNWDATMFFRDGDAFSFLAPSFNRLKDQYLRKIYDSEDTLIQLKDKLSNCQEISPELRQELTDLIRTEARQQN